MLIRHLPNRQMTNLREITQKDTASD